MVDFTPEEKIEIIKDSLNNIYDNQRMNQAATYNYLSLLLEIIEDLDREIKNIKITINNRY